MSFLTPSPRGIETICDHAFGQMTYAEALKEFKVNYWREC
jgi:hypothetical protein